MSIIPVKIDLWDGSDTAKIIGQRTFESVDEELALIDSGAGGDVIPTMTGASAPSGTVTASTETTGKLAWNAFDDTGDTSGTRNLWLATASTGWLAYEFPSSIVISFYTIEVAYDASTSNTAPKDWKFQGWNGSSWVDLHTIAGQTGWADNEKRSFSCSNTTSYIKYRIDITANDGGTYVGIAEMEMWEEIDNSYYSLLVHCDGADTSTTFTDVSDNSHSITAGGAGQVDTAQKKFGTGSLLLDGSQDYIYMTNAGAFTFGTEDLTMNFHVRLNDTTDCVFMECLTDYDHRWIFQYDAGSIKFKAETSTGVWVTFISKAWTPSTGTWYHVELTRFGDTWNIFIDGTSLGTTVTTDSIASYGYLYIGNDGNLTANLSPDGWMDEIRILKGIAMHTANFTAPTASYEMAGYATNSPSPAEQWENLPSGASVDMSTIRIVENVNAGDAGSVKYQYAKNGGSLNGTWLTQASLRGETDFTVSDATDSLKIVPQYISDGTQKTTSQAFAVVDIDVTGGSGSALIVNPGMGGGLD